MNLQINWKNGNIRRHTHRADSHPLGTGEAGNRQSSEKVEETKRKRYLAMMNKSHLSYARVCTRVPYLYILSSHNKCILQGQQKSIEVPPIVKFS